MNKLVPKNRRHSKLRKVARCTDVLNFTCVPTVVAHESQGPCHWKCPKERFTARIARPVTKCITGKTYHMSMKATNLPSQTSFKTRRPHLGRDQARVRMRCGKQSLFVGCQKTDAHKSHESKRNSLAISRSPPGKTRHRTQCEHRAGLFDIEAREDEKHHTFMRTITDNVCGYEHDEDY